MPDDKLKADWEKELLDISFPENVIESAKSAREAGLFELHPDPDAIERTIEACKKLVAPPSPKV